LGATRGPLQIWDVSLRDDELKSKETDRVPVTQRKTEIRLNTRLLPILAALFAILYGLTGYRGWLVFFIGTGGAWLLAILWVLSLKRGLSIERNIHLAWATVGESVPERLKVINNSWLPALWLEIIDTSVSLADPVRLVSDVGAHATRWRYPNHQCQRRGLYTLGPTCLRTGDPFGIYALTIYNSHSDSILVTPPLLPLAQLKIAPGGWAGDQRRRRGGLERDIGDSGVRNYLPGDSLRRIHWSASAHNDTLIVRRLEAATSGDWWIFVDLDETAQAGSGQDTTVELAIVLAASLAVRGLKERRRVGLALAGPQLVWLEPRAESAQRWRLLRALATAEPGRHSLAELLAVGRPGRTATMIFITPTADPAWVAVARRGRRNGSMMALLVDPASFGRPVDQASLIRSLAYSSIPYNRMSKALLDEAYASHARSLRTRAGGVETGKRYLQQGIATWQSMD
jgi:uncharacterized protein (DUF58 family)